jgi:hypothetical protein
MRYILLKFGDALEDFDQSRVKLTSGKFTKWIKVYRGKGFFVGIGLANATQYRRPTSQLSSAIIKVEKV